MSFLIKLIEGTDHSHSFISWRDPHIDVRKVAEARGAGGRIVTNIKFKKDNEVTAIFQYQIPRDKLDELEKWVWENLGAYGYKQILGILYMRIMMAVGLRKKAHNPFKDGLYSQICVELSARAIEKATGQDLPGEIEDYGLIEMADINRENEIRNICKSASKELIDRINGKK